MKPCEHTDELVSFTFNKGDKEAEEIKTLHGTCPECSYSLVCEVDRSQPVNVDPDELKNLMIDNVTNQWASMKERGFCGKMLEVLAQDKYDKAFEDLNEKQQNEIVLNLREEADNFMERVKDDSNNYQF